MKTRRFMVHYGIQSLITLLALSAILGHQVWPQIRLDAPSLFLLAVAVVPWVGSILKSLELPGGFKVEFREKSQDIKNRAEDVGLLSDKPTLQQETAMFSSIVDRDPNLALAGLRIEIEKRLRSISQEVGIQANRVGTGALLAQLRRAEVISGQQASVLADLLPLLNQGVHGEKVPPEAVDWVMDIGPRLLTALDERALQIKKGKS